MARYIDVDKLLEELQEEIEFETTTYTEEQNKWFNIGLKCAVRDVKSQPTADVEEVKRGYLRVELNKDCFKNKELAKERGWYRKFFYCPNCNTNIITETWEKHHMFGMSTVLKSNETPKFCPECGMKIRGDAE